MNRTSSSIGIGVGVFLINIKKKLILVGKRKNGDLLGLPGGWLDFSEDWNSCAKRELFEETDLTKSKNEFYHIHTLNCKFTENNYHNISCIMYSEISDNEESKIKNKEPKKCYGWFWASVAYLRQNSEKLFYPLRQFLLQFQNILSTDDLKKMIV
jgi:8-oxo-dGTP diphosphatase